MMWAAVELAAELNFGKVEEDGKKRWILCECVFVCMNSAAAHLRS